MQRLPSSLAYFTISEAAIAPSATTAGTVLLFILCRRLALGIPFISAVCFIVWMTYVHANKSNNNNNNSIPHLLTCYFNSTGPITRLA